MSIAHGQLWQHSKKQEAVVALRSAAARRRSMGRRNYAVASLIDQQARWHLR